MLADIGLVYCAAIWGSTFILVKGALDSVNPVAMVAIRFLIAAVLLLPWVLKRKDLKVHMAEGFFLIQMLAQKGSTPFKVGLIFTLEPVFAAAFAWTLGGESFVPMKAAGGFLIVLGMIMGELSKIYSARAAAKEVLPV